MEREVRRETISTNNKRVQVALHRRSIDILDKKGRLHDVQRVYWGEITAMDEPMTLYEIMNIYIPTIGDSKQIFLSTAEEHEYYINKKGVVFRKNPYTTEEEVLGTVATKKTLVALNTPATLVYKKHKLAAVSDLFTIEERVDIGTITSIRFSEEKV